MTTVPPPSTTTEQAKPTPRPRRSRRSRRISWQRLLGIGISVAMVLLAVVYLVVPGWWQWATANPQHTSDQLTTETPATSPELAAALRALPASPQSAPVILTYHNISPTPGFYTVSPTAFAAQMQLLHDAGYYTITANQLDGWRHGAPLPAHAVLLTFDDGPRGVWQYADPILARYGFHAMAFIITGFVGTHQPYYMNWPEITAMAASGRWDIESHTHLGHVQVTINAHGDQQPFLTSQRYLAAEHRPETLAEYTRRVATDLAESKNQLVEHGLPAPNFFAYPYSANAGDPQVTAVLHQLVANDFHAAMLDDAGGSIATTPADLAAGNLHRTDVTADVTLDQWVTRIRNATGLDPTIADPFNDTNNWMTADGTPTHLAISNDSTTLDPGPKNWTGRLYAYSQTTLWRRYTVTATLGGFHGPGDGTTTGLRVLANDPQQVQAAVSDGSYQVRQGIGQTQKIISEGHLPLATDYPVAVTVSGAAVVVTINGAVVSTVALHPNNGQLPAGGIEFTAQRGKTSSPPSQISHLTTAGSK